MGLIVAGRGAAFPQTGLSRTKADVVKDILDYVGGESDDTMKDRAGRALNMAIRKFNQSAWKFNRLTEDILLDATLGMKPNAAAPTISRDAGVLSGFTLDSGKTMTYWIEERVKVGFGVVKRNDENGTKTVVLTGDGTNDKPVLTLPSVVNPDTTHRAIFATKTNGIYPEGAELGEIPVATTTFEDPRTGNNPNLPTGQIYRGGDFDLSADFRMAIRGNLLDDVGRERWSIQYVDWIEYSQHLSRMATTSRPLWYTIRNAWRTGKVTFYPRPAGTLTYPVARITYDCRIPTLAGDSDLLSVPPEVESAILAAALVPMIAKYRSFQDAQFAQADAASQFNNVATQYEDFEDFS